MTCSVNSFICIFCSNPNSFFSDESFLFILPMAEDEEHSGKKLNLYFNTGTIKYIFYLLVATVAYCETKSSPAKAVSDAEEPFCVKWETSDKSRREDCQ
jgi:hypothetical protein